MCVCTTDHGPPTARFSDSCCTNIHSGAARSHVCTKANCGGACQVKRGQARRSLVVMYAWGSAARVALCNQLRAWIISSEACGIMIACISVSTWHSACEFNARAKVASGEACDGKLAPRSATARHGERSQAPRRPTNHFKLRIRAKMVAPRSTAAARSARLRGPTTARPAKPSSQRKDQQRQGL